MSNVATRSATRFSDLLASAAKLPGVRINREVYLRSALKNVCTEDQVAKAISETPAVAGISREIIDSAAKDSIRFEAVKVTALSTAAGVPGLPAMVVTVPADLVQYLGHMLRISQKLAYLYSWPDLFELDADEMDDGTQAVLTLFAGVMFGTQSANVAVGKIAVMLSEQAVKKLPQKALTKGLIYPVVKTVAGMLGVKMTRLVFARGVAKVVPVAGAVICGGVSLATFVPMSYRLKRHLSSLDIARPVGGDGLGCQRRLLTSRIGATRLSKEKVMSPSSFEYTEPWSEPSEPRVCPHCKQPIQPGDDVHWWQDTLWHTKPCPGTEAELSVRQSRSSSGSH